MQIEKMKPGSKFFVDIQRGEYYFTLSSKLLDIDDDTVFLSEPFLEEGQIQELRERDVIYIRTFSDNGQSMYRWTCIEWETIKKNGINKLKIKLEKEGQLFNRREAFRLDLSHPVEAWSCLNGFFPAVVKDISILGVALESKHELKFGDIVKVSLEEDESVVEMVAKVVRKHNAKESNATIYGCSFIDTSSNLGKFVNNKQLEYIKRSRSVKKV